MFILIMSFPPSTFWLCNQNQDSDEDAYDEGSESESGNDGDPNAGSSGIHHPAPPVEPCVEPRVEPHVVEPPVEPRVEPPVEPRVEPHVEPCVEPHVEPVPLEVAPPPSAAAGVPSLPTPANAEGGKWESQKLKLTLHDHTNPLRWKCGIPWSQAGQDHGTIGRVTLHFYSQNFLYVT